MDNVLQIDSDNDDPPILPDDTSIDGATFDPGIRRKGKHGLLQYLRSNVNHVVDYLSADHEKRAPLHETLYVEDFRREESYPLPNEHETFWVDGDVGTQVRTSEVLFTLKSKRLASLLKFVPSLRYAQRQCKCPFVHSDANVGRLCFLLLLKQVLTF